MGMKNETLKLPAELQNFLNTGNKEFHCDEDDWEVQIAQSKDTHLRKTLSPESIIIAKNGCGDYLFLPTLTNPEVHVFWHEEQREEIFAAHIRNLTNPPQPVPSACKQILYHDGKTEVRLGDEVSARDVFFRRDGRVNYLPGVSKKNRNMEHGGLCWVGIKFQRGTYTGTIVDPKSFKLKKSIRFLRRSTELVQELGPNEQLE